MTQKKEFNLTPQYFKSQWESLNKNGADEASLKKTANQIREALDVYKNSYVSNKSKLIDLLWYVRKMDLQKRMDDYENCDFDSFSHSRYGFTSKQVEELWNVCQTFHKEITQDGYSMEFCHKIMVKCGKTNKILRGLFKDLNGAKPEEFNEIIEHWARPKKKTSQQKRAETISALKADVIKLKADIVNKEKKVDDYNSILNQLQSEQDRIELLKNTIVSYKAKIKELQAENAMLRQENAMLRKDTVDITSNLKNALVPKKSVATA